MTRGAVGDSRQLDPFCAIVGASRGMGASPRGIPLSLRDAIRPTKFVGGLQCSLEIAVRSAKETSSARTVTLLDWLSSPSFNSGKGPPPTKANA